jgi:hypothetical protein
MNYRIAFILRGVALLAVLPTSVYGQQDRIIGRVDSLQPLALRGNVNPNANVQFDTGPIDPSMRLNHVMLMLKRSDAQQAALDQLLADQQNRSSPNYHNWLTPEQFGDRFAISPNDTAQLSSWLQSQGLVVDEVARSRNWIWFSGTAGQVQTALHTTIRHYRVDGELHFANADEPSVPASIGPLVIGILGLDDFQPKSPQNNSHRLYTSPNGGHLLAPDDFATIYDLFPLYNGGFDGSGQKIVVIGRSDVALADIQLFRKFFNLPMNDPQLLLVPGSSDPGTNGVSPGDELEADLDIEWSGAVARNASIIYVYSTNVATISIPYAIDQNLAPIITYSFGGCEQQKSPNTISTTRALAQQANAQGVTWLASSGDSGAAGCDPDFSNPVASYGLGVSFPASLPEVTGVGGTEFVGGGTYWSTSNSINFASALSYIPEQGWNDSGSNGLASSGGGFSTLFAQPTWQTGPGVPNGSGRTVPDVSLSAGGDGVGYLIVEGGQLALVEGTSAATPTFAGILALVNQYQLANGEQTQSGQGNINPNLYSLAQTAANVFHDITTGNNIVPCRLGTPGCSAAGMLGYAAGPGYDLVTGLGSVDGYNLAGALATQWSIPAITLLNPSNVIAGGTFTLAVTGTGFGSGSVVQWMGASLPTTFISGTYLLATVSAALIAVPGSAPVTVLGAHGTSAPSSVVVSPSFGAIFNSQRVTTTPPPASSGCGVTPPAVNSFQGTTATVYLYFLTTLTLSDQLSFDWVAPNGAVVLGISGDNPVPGAGYFCFTRESLPLGNLPFSNIGGTWQARVFDKGILLFSIPFTVDLPLGGQSFSASASGGSVTFTLPAGFPWIATSTANWITFTGSGSGLGSGTLNYQVAANSGTDRSGVITIGDYGFTVEQEAASIFGLSLIGSMPHIAAQENWTTTFTMVNNTSLSNQARLNLFGSNIDASGSGNPLLLPLSFPQQPGFGSLLGASLDNTLAPFASWIVGTTEETAGAVQTGSAQALATGALGGFAIFHRISDNQEAVVPLTPGAPNAPSYLLSFDNTNGIVTAAAVANVATQAANLGYIIRDDTGAKIASGSISLPGSGQTSFDLPDPVNGFPATVGIRGTVEFDTPPGGQISVLGIRNTPQVTATGTVTTLTTVPALANVATGGGSFAFVASGGDGWQTTFVLVNAGSAPAPATLRFRDPNGNPLPLPISYPQIGAVVTNVSSISPTIAAGATLLVQSTGAPSLLTGSAQLTSAGNVSGFVIFRHNGQEAVVPMESRNASAYLLAFDNTNGTATGIAVNNVSASVSPVNIPVVVRNDSGAQLATHTLTLAANGGLSGDLAETLNGQILFPETANIRGTVEFDAPSATVQIGVIGIRTPATQTYTSLPALVK